MNLSLIYTLITQSLMMTISVIFFNIINMGKPKLKVLLLYLSNIIVLPIIYLIFGRNIAVILERIVILLYCMFYNDNKKLSFRTLMGVICNICTILVDFVISYILIKYLKLISLDNVEEINIQYAIFMIPLFIIVMMFISLIFSIFNNRNNFTKINLIFFINPVVQFTLMYLMSRMLAKYKIAIQDNLILIIYVIVTMLGILSNAWTIKISDNIITNKFLEQQKSFLVRYNGIAMDFNKTTTDNLLKIRKIKHDFNNSIQTIKSLIDNNNFDEASKLATELEQKYNEITINNKYCNNSILNAIIQQNKDICSNYDITLNINCSMPENIPIKLIDICSIANNMLQNSIEAVKSIDDISKRNIDFSVWIEKHMIFFKTVNPKTHNIKKVGNKILTSKKTDTQNHGLGLEIIEDTAKSYNGDYTIEYDDTSFILIVYLNIS